jgi:predicted extracellular nuclease
MKTLLALLLLTVTALAQSTLRIGAWNIEHLGEPGLRSGGGKNVAQSASDIADYIRHAQVDILALEEININTGTMFTDRNQTISAALTLIRQQTGQKWDHMLFRGPSGDKTQTTGIAWNTTKVRRVGSPDPILTADPGKFQDQHGNHRMWDRRPTGIKFRALSANNASDFIVVPIHMKADFQGDHANQRAAEAQKFVEALPAARQRFADKDFVLLGDYNCAGHAEPAVTTLRNAGFRDLNAADQKSHISFGPLDRALVAKSQPEFTGASYEVVRQGFLTAKGWTATQFRKNLSDHFMIVTKVRVLTDDD